MSFLALLWIGIALSHSFLVVVGYWTEENMKEIFLYCALNPVMIAAILVTICITIPRVFV